MESFAKKIKLLLDRFSLSFRKRRKSVEKMTHRKKTRGHRTSKIVKPTQSNSNGHLPYYCSLYYLARALDAWRGMWISCAVRMRRIGANVLNLYINAVCAGVGVNSLSLLAVAQRTFFSTYQHQCRHVMSHCMWWCCPGTCPVTW